MQSNIALIICVVYFVICVHARSIDQIESGKEGEMSKESKDELYNKLLAYLQAEDANTVKDDSSSSSSEENIKPLPKRGFFLFPNRRSNQQRLRPIYSYGRKSHWDTFFG